MKIFHIIMVSLLLTACARTEFPVPNDGEGPGLSSSEANAPLTSSEQLLAEDEIRTHIEEWSPIQPVLGGHFIVTDIAWTADNTALVYYEDGHIAAVGHAHVTRKNGTISIDAFTAEEL